MSSKPLRGLILVGGYGTRLRPLTLSVPKPLVDFANKPMIVHQIEALRDAGVTEVVLAINYQPAVMYAFINEYESKLGVKITISQETEPMGTAGPLALARDKLLDGSGEPFFVLNADVICEYPLKELLAFHKSRPGAEATLFVTKVEEPSKYGVVLFDEASGCVDRFVEKPQVFCGNKINAGIYVLSPSVLDRIQLRPTSIEKEIFPPLAQEGKLFAMVMPGFWMDIGQPRDYLTGLTLYLRSLRERSPELLAKAESAQLEGVSVVGNVLVDPTAIVAPGCKLGPDVSVGPGCVIEQGVRLTKCTILRGAKVKEHACVAGSVVGWHSIIGKWARLDNCCVLGEDVQVADEKFLNGSVVLPHKELKDDLLSPGIIM